MKSSKTRVLKELDNKTSPNLIKIVGSNLEESGERIE